MMSFFAMSKSHWCFFFHMAMLLTHFWPIPSWGACPAAPPPPRWSRDSPPEAQRNAAPRAPDPRWSTACGRPGRTPSWGRWPTSWTGLRIGYIFGDGNKKHQNGDDLMTLDDLGMVYDILWLDKHHITVGEDWRYMIELRSNEKHSGNSVEPPSVRQKSTKHH